MDRNLPRLLTDKLFFFILSNVIEWNGFMEHSDHSTVVVYVFPPERIAVNAWCMCPLGICNFFAA